VIRKVYEKLDKTGTGAVTLDDIARNYNLRANRDLTTAIRTQD